MDWTDRAGLRLKLRDLHILLAVAEWGSMAKAAKYLAVSQPVISRAIADLEHAIGVRVLDRGSRGVEPTIYGKTLLSRGRAIFGELKGSVEDIRFLKGTTEGEIRIGSNDSISGGLLTSVLDQLSIEHPRLKFSLKLADAATLHYRDLRERNIDLIFGRMVVPVEAEDVTTEVLFEERLYVVGGVDNPWTRRRKLHIQELTNVPWVLPPPETLIGSLILSALRGSGLVTPHITATGYSILWQISLLGTGHFLTVLPGSFLRVNGNRFGLKALPIDLPGTTRPVGIVTLKNRTISPVAELLIKCARSIAKPLATGASQLHLSGASM